MVRVLKFAIFVTKFVKALKMNMHKYIIYYIKSQLNSYSPGLVDFKNIKQIFISL